jgi:hypothetical protein
MTFIRENLPDPVTYFEGAGLKLTGPRSSKWRTTRCEFHGGSDSMRINVTTGGWVCMACSEKGGDVLAYHIALHDTSFIEAARQLGCWQDDGKPEHTRPTPLPARDALQVLCFELTLIGIEASRFVNGRTTDSDLERLQVGIGRISRIAEAYIER